MAKEEEKMCYRKKSFLLVVTGVSLAAGNFITQKRENFLTGNY